MIAIVIRIVNFFRCHRMLRVANASLDIQHEDIKYYQSRIETLTSSLSNAVTIPDISEFTTNLTIVEPYKINNNKYDLLCADHKYYALPEIDWQAILTIIQNKVSKVLIDWKEEITDCDDWSLLMSAFIVAAFAKAGLDKQGAFAINWSNNHAYNSYITSSNKWITYEPQNDERMGTLDNAYGNYETVKIWFMG